MIYKKTKTIFGLIRRIFLILLITLTTSFVYSQPEQIQFDHISSFDGLSNNCVNCIFQDNQGFMWFGTHNGLNKFDGYRIKIYSHKSVTPYPISSSSISCIYQDKSGTLWIGTWGGGLNIFDGKTEKFTSFKHNSTDQNSISSSKISSIFEDNDGNLWIGTFGGLNKFNRKTKTFTHFKHDPNNSNSLSDDFIITVYEDKEGFLWIGTNNNGLDKFDKKKETFIHYTHDPSNPYSISSNFIRTIYEDVFSTLWIGTAFGGLNGFNRKNNTFTHFIYDSTNTHCLSDNTVLSIFDAQLNQDGILWIGTSIGGLNAYNRKTGKFTYFKNNPNDPSSISGNNISSIYQDNSGNLWLGTLGKGINKFKLQNKFKHFRREPHNSNSLNNNCVRAICEDKYGLLWIGTFGGGLNRYNSENNLYTYFKHDSTKINSLSNDKIYSIYEDSYDNLWVGTRNGLDKFDRENETFLHYKPDPNNPDLKIYYRNNIVSAIYEDRSGTFWIGTFGGGLFEFDRDNLTFTSYKCKSGNIQSSKSNTISSIYEDKSGTLWIGTWGDGLKKFDKKTKQFYPYRNNPNISNSLSSNIVTSICEDLFGNLWIGTFRTGLNNFDRVNNRFINYTKDDGLISNRIIGILEDNNGYLWINTNKGLSRFDIANNTFINYSRESGVDHYLRSGKPISSAMGGYFKSKTGEIFFGGINGFIYFNPDRILKQSHIPSIVLTGFKVFGKNIKFDRTISDIDEIELSHKSNYFTFEFALLDFTDAQKNQYAYKLEGLDKDWIYSGNRHYASYSNLAPGKYILKIKGANHEGIWNTKGVSIDVIITPPFWKTWWFRILLTLLLLGTILSIFWIRLSSIQAQKRKLESLVFKRTSEINKITNHLAQEVKVRRDTELNLRKSEEKFRDLFENANDIIWTSDINGKLLSVNHLFEILSGYSKFELIGNQSIELVIPEHRIRTIKNHKKVINGKQVEYEIETISRNNERKSLWLKLRPLKENGKVVGVHGIGRDITYLKKTEKELKEAEELKRESLKQLTLKLAHEIKNPLASIKSSAQLVASSKVTGTNTKIQKHMDVINRNVDICDKVIRDLYSFTHRPELELSKVKVSDFIKRMKSFTSEKVDHGKKIKVYINIEDKISKIYADEFRLSQAFKNIINNAFDAMSYNGILTINSKFIDSSKEVLIEIIDNGCGISSDNLKYIFQPFYSSKPTGFGLGLPLVKEIIEAHGGQIEVESKLQEGSKFKIRIPAVRKK